MKVGWLHDNPRHRGGAELTMAEFEAAAPPEVEVIDCPTGNVTPGLDRYVVGNCMNYEPWEIPEGAIRYHHDLSRPDADLCYERHIFCSPQQRDRMGHEGVCIPPAIDLERFRAVANQNHRKGAVCIARRTYGKGLERLEEYSEPIDLYTNVPPDKVPDTLARYERFVFLPTAFEPFGRAVVEAWAAGLELIVNRMVGARYWLEENPKALETAAGDFWEAICG